MSLFTVLQAGSTFILSTGVLDDKVSALQHNIAYRQMSCHKRSSDLLCFGHRQYGHKTLRRHGAACV